jgi:hypothetical protein
MQDSTVARFDGRGLINSLRVTRGPNERLARNRFTVPPYVGTAEHPRLLAL